MVPSWMEQATEALRSDKPGVKPGTCHRLAVIFLSCKVGIAAPSFPCNNSDDETKLSMLNTRHKAGQCQYILLLSTWVGNDNSPLVSIMLCKELSLTVYNDGH